MILPLQCDGLITVWWLIHSLFVTLLKVIPKSITSVWKFSVAGSSSLETIRGAPSWEELLGEGGITVWTDRLRWIKESILKCGFHYLLLKIQFCDVEIGFLFLHPWYFGKSLDWEKINFLNLNLLLFFHFQRS